MYNEILTLIMQTGQLNKDSKNVVMTAVKRILEFNCFLYINYFHVYYYAEKQQKAVKNSKK